MRTLETAVNGPRPLRLASLQPAAGTLACLISLAAIGLMAGCGPRDAQPAAPDAAASGAPAASGASAAATPASAASMPPVSVTLVRAQVRDFTIALEASGTVAALSSVDIKPQISAQVLAVHVKEGQFVERGAPLFTLDARVDAANLKKAEAQLLKDEATLADARRQLARSQDLLAKNFVSQGAVDTAQANVEGQQAVVAADRAAIDAVKAQLSFARIAAPSAGRVGQIAVYPGSSVSPSGAAMLTLTQINPMAVAFSLPQRQLGDALAALQGGGAGKPGAAGSKAGPGGKGKADGQAKAASAAKAPASGASGAASGGKGGGKDTRGLVTAVLPDGLGQRQGKLVFVDSAVDASSGTVKAKAQFDNKDQALWPGAYVTVKMAVQTLPDAVVVPQAAIVQGARGTAVFVAGPGNVAAVRPVKVLAQAGADAVVSGLKGGERIVMDGRQNVRPGSPLIERAAEPGRGGSGAASGAAGGAASGAGARASGAGPGASGASAAASAGGRAP